MKVIVILLAVFLLVGCLAAIPLALFDFRTNEVEETFAVSTGAGVTNATRQLAQPLWDDSITYASVSSNNTAEIPTVASYNATTRALTITNLAESTAHILTVTYNSAALDDYTGAETGISFVPVAIVLAIILIPLAVIVSALTGRFG